jgi:hypothetical protein
MRQASSRPRLELVDEGMSGVLLYVDALDEILLVQWEICKLTGGEERLLQCLGIAMIAVRIIRGGVLLLSRRRSGDERGIIERPSKMCMAKWCGCRSGRGPRAEGTRRRTVVRSPCLGRGVVVRWLCL